MKLDRRSGSILAVAALAAATLATAALADRQPKGEGGALPMMMERFDEMDADKDGKVTEAEVTAFRAARFAVMDSNKDGVLDQAELAAFRLTQLQARAAADAERMIERFDKGGDGTLIAEELPWMPGTGPMFTRLDADDDGAVSKEELTAAAERFAEHRGKGKPHGKGDRPGRDGGTGWWWDMRAAE